MPISRSRKILLITNNTEIQDKLLPVLAKNNLAIADHHINLYSVSSISKEMQNASNTTFLRTELLKFIKDTGFPYFIAIDFRIDSGLPEEIDPDHMKILRTLLISYIILARGRGFEKIQGNFILFGNESDEKLLSEINTDPKKILSFLATQDRAVNSFIDELKQNGAKFNKLFFLKTIDSTLPPNQMEPLITTYIRGIVTREQFFKPDIPETIIENGDYPPASVVYRLSKQALFRDREMVPVETPEDRELETGRFYIIGHWTNRTLMDVAGKLTESISKGLGDDVSFDKEDEIIIEMTERCKLDATTTSSLVQMLSKEFLGYKNMRVVISADNEKILAQSKGYGLLKKYLRRS